MFSYAAKWSSDSSAQIWSDSITRICCRLLYSSCRLAVQLSTAFKPHLPDLLQTAAQLLYSCCGHAVDMLYSSKIMVKLCLRTPVDCREI